MLRTALVAIAAICLCAASALADEVKLDSKIESVSLFKNGLAVVERSVQVPGPGVYRLDATISPVLGTFWIDGDVPVEARMTTREVDTPLRMDTNIDFQQGLVGKQVTVHFHDATIAPASGKVVELARPKADEQFSRDYQQNGQYYGQPQPAAFLVLDNDKQGRVYVNTSVIDYIESAGGANIHERQPVMLLTVGSEQKGPATIHVSYVTRGIAWCPSYRVTLLDDKTLSIEQQAVIKNELEDLHDCEVKLISGFPSVQFGNVDSLLCMNQTWANFFAQLNGNGQLINGAIAMNGPQAGGVTNSIFGGNGGNGGGGNGRPAGLAAEDDVDVNYFSIGKRTMDTGDALALNVAKNQASYERVVEWIIPDARDTNGDLVLQRDANGNNVPLDNDTSWDALRFTNPLPFAMTSAPAMVLDGGKFAGQQLSEWVNTKEQTTLRITKALSLRTHVSEQEDDPTNRTGVVIAGRNYQKVTVSGKLTMENRRSQDVTIIVRREYSGQMVDAEDKPTIKGREVAGYVVNPANEMDWTVSLKPGEIKTIKYSYTVLVP